MADESPFAPLASILTEKPLILNTILEHNLSLRLGCGFSLDWPGPTIYELFQLSFPPGTEPASNTAIAWKLQIVNVYYQGSRIGYPPYVPDHLRPAIRNSQGGWSTDIDDGEYRTYSFLISWRSAEKEISSKSGSEYQTKVLSALAKCEACGVRTRSTHLRIQQTIPQMMHSKLF